MSRIVWILLVALSLVAPVARAQEDEGGENQPGESETGESDWDEDLFTDDVVVRALSEAEELEQSSDSVRVIETDEARTQSADMGEVLARSEGVSVRRSGGLGSSARICIQGVCDRGVRYFLDGVPLELAGFGNGVASVPVNLVERLEIYRGAVPVRLGTDALGGVINLVRSGSYFAPHVSASLQTGSWGTYRLAYDAGYRDDATGLYAGVQAFYDHADNDYWIDVDAADGRGRERRARVRRFHDAYEAYGIAVEAGLVGVSFADRLTVRGFVTEHDRELQHNFVMTLPYGEPVYGELGAGGLLRYQHEIVPGLALDAFVGYTRRELEYRDTGAWVYDWFGRRGRARRGAGGEVDGHARDQVIWEHAIPSRLSLGWQIAPEHALSLSVAPEYTTRSGDQRIQSDPGGRDPLTARRELFTMVSGLSYDLTLWDGVLENQLYVKDYVYLASTEERLPGDTFVDRRVDRHEIGFGDGLRVRIVDGLLVRGTYEYATRLPDAYEVFGDGVLVQPSLELLPERSHNGTLELALDLGETPIGAIDATLTGFVRWRENMIVLIGREAEVSHQNVYEALAAGAEASVGWTSPGDWVSLGANATYIDDRNRSSEGTFGDYVGDRIPSRPWLFASFFAQLRARDMLGRDDLSLSWRARYVHTFLRVWETGGIRDDTHIIPSQLGQDLALTYSLLGPPRISTTLEVTNLTDEPLYDLYGVQRPGRSVYLKVTLDY